MPRSIEGFCSIPRLLEGFRCIFQSCLAAWLPWAQGLRPCNITVGNVGLVTLLCHRSSQPRLLPCRLVSNASLLFSTVLTQGDRSDSASSTSLADQCIAETQVSCRLGDSKDLLLQLMNRRRKLSYNVTVLGSILQLSSDNSTSITKLEEKEGKGRKWLAHCVSLRLSRQRL